MSPYLNHQIKRAAIAVSSYVLAMVILAFCVAGCDHTSAPNRATQVQPTSPTVLQQRVDVLPPEELTAKVRVGDTVLDVPLGSSVVVEHSREQDQSGPSSSFARSAQSQGAGLTTTSADSAIEFDASAPQTSLSGQDGGTASGGSTSASAILTGVKPTNPLIWIGALMLVAAGVLFYLKQVVAAATAAVVGVLMIAIAAFPGFGLLLAIGGLVLVACVYAGNIAITGTSKVKTEGTLREVLATVESTAAETRQAIKKQAATSLSKTAKAVVSKVKQKHNLPSERPN